MGRPRKGGGGKRGAGKSTANSTDLHEHEPEEENGGELTPDEGEDCRLDGGVDGSFTLSRQRRAPRERGDREADLPDEEPPGWCAS